MKKIVLALVFLLAACTPMELPGYAFDVVEWVSSNHHTYEVTKLPTLDGNWFDSFHSLYAAQEYLTIYIAKDRAAGVPMDDELTRIAQAFPNGTERSVVRSWQTLVYKVYTTEESPWEAEYMYGALNG